MRVLLCQERDPVEGYAWFALAAVNGHGPSVAAMAPVAAGITKDQLAEAQRRAVAMAAELANQK